MKLVLGVGHTAAIDIDALDELEYMVAHWEEKGVEVYVTGAHGEILRMLEHTKFYANMAKKGHVFRGKSELLDKVL